MEILILKTNINRTKDFYLLKNNLEKSFSLRECTIDLDDKDKVVRVVGENLNPEQINLQIGQLGFISQELPD